jgi:hypothetical protein
VLLLADPHHQVGEAVEEGDILGMGDAVLREHPARPGQDVFLQHLVLLVALLHLVLLRHQQLVIVLLQALVVALRVLRSNSLLGEDLLLGQQSVLEAGLEGSQLSLEGSDSFEGFVVGRIVLLHPF